MRHRNQDKRKKSLKKNLRAVFQSELKLILELKLIFPKNEQRLMNTRMIAFDELKLIFNLKMNECNLWAQIDFTNKEMSWNWAGKYLLIFK